MPRSKASPIITDELCSYGCGEVAKYINKSGNLMCCELSTKCPEIRKKNSDKLKEIHKDGPMYDYHSLPEETKKRMNWNKGKIFEPKFEYDSPSKNIKKYLIQEIGHKCQCCGLEEWMGKQIPIELEHIDGDHRNNVRENLTLLCPNCHAQTPTWKRGKDGNKGTKVSDDELLKSLLEHKSIRAALIAVGLSGKGWNYKRCYRLINDYSHEEKILMGFVESDYENHEERLKIIETTNTDGKALLEQKLSLIRNSGIDFSVFGWVQNVSELIGVSHTHVRRIMGKYLPDIMKTAYKRKPR